MKGLTPHDITMLLLGIAVLLGSARVLGELMQRFRQPAVVGEILAGVILGPTLLGNLLPAFQTTLFPQEGAVAVALQGLSTLAIVLFLLVAGMEIDLSSIWKQGKSVALVGILGIVGPLLIGFGPALAAPGWFGAGEVSTPLFAAFFGTAMAITALPVIAKILMDMKMLQTGLGVTIVSAAIVNDLIGWIIFAFILSMLGVAESHYFSPAMTATLTLCFILFSLTFGRWLLNRSLPWIQAHSTWPAGVLGFAATMALLCAAFTEWIGVHAIFGAFIFGIALGDSPHLRRRTRTTIEQFISSIFAPIFFASIGLKADFVANFDLLLVLVVLVIATVGKVGACWLAAKWAGFERRDALAIGFGMNARGAMEIVLGLLALEAGVITERLFVALVVMAIVTSMTSGVLMQRSFGRQKKVSYTKFANARTFTPDLPTNRTEAVEYLCELAAAEAGVDPVPITRRILRQEQQFGSALGNGLAIPHARLPGLTKPIVAVGLSRPGLDFDARDGQPVWVVMLVISPDTDPAIHLSILASIAESFRTPETAAHAAATARTLTELYAFLRTRTEDEDK